MMLAVLSGLPSPRRGIGPCKKVGSRGRWFRLSTQLLRYFCVKAWSSKGNQFASAGLAALTT
eukprot:9798479-Karenia_brevis.AAC.1